MKADFLSYRMIWDAWDAMLNDGSAHDFLASLRASVPMSYTMRSEEPEAYQAIVLGSPKYAVWYAVRCVASNSVMAPHTCGLDKTLYLQGNPHSHDGVACEDWSHCTITSDEQRAMQ